MLKIRPHHILCMRAYSGSGYSQEFKDEIERIIKEIKVYNEFLNISNIENEIKEVNLVCYTDSICEKCINKIGENKCSSQEKVNRIDLKVVEYFNLKEGIYKYKELEELVYSSITEEIFDDICKVCEWYDITNCKKYIIK